MPREILSIMLEDITMKRKVQIDKAIAGGDINNLVDRKVEFESVEAFVETITKLAKKTGWNLECFSMFFTRDNKDGDWRSDGVFVTTYQI